MDIYQKKLSNKTAFVFKDNYLSYSLKDKQGSGDFDIRYTDFPKKPSEYIEQNEWLRNVGAIWLLMGSYIVFQKMYNTGVFPGINIWMILGALCLIWFFVGITKFSLFTTEKTHVFVIKDKNHDQIVSEILNRRKEKYLELYGDINPENEIQYEIDKFKWLEEEGILTPEEVDQKIALLENEHNKDDISYQ